MATLTANITASATQIAVTGSTAGAQPGQQYRIDDEIVTLTEFVRTKADRRGPRNPNSWRISRGELGTTAASHSAGADIFAVAPAVATSESLAEPEPYASAGEGGGVAVLEDPGNTYPEATAVALGHRIKETLQGEVRVFEVSNAGTTEGTSMADFGYNLAPRGVTPESDVEWTYLGIVGQLSWDVVPQLPGISVAGDDTDDPLRFVFASLAPPGDSESLVVLRATVDDVPVSVFEAKTDGDADWQLDENAGAGFRFNVAVDGEAVIPGKFVQMTSAEFKVSHVGVGSFTVNFDPFFVRMSDLPTADPGVGHAGELWVDVAAGRVLKVSAG